MKDPGLNRLLDHAEMTPAGQRFLRREDGWSMRPLRMRWRKDRFIGKIRRRAEWQCRRLLTLYSGAHHRDDIALDAKAAERDRVLDTMVRDRDMIDIANKIIALNFDSLFTDAEADAET